MRLDLAVDELEAIPCIGHLFLKAGGELGEQVTVLQSGSFCVQVQLGDLAGKQRVALRIQSSHVALGVAYLARNAQKLGGRALTGDGGMDLTVIVQQTLQGFRVSTVVGLIGAGHQQGEVPLFGRIAREVGMHALGDLSKEGLETGRRIELFGRAGIAERSVMGLLCAQAGFRGPAASGVGVVEVDFAFGDARFEIVELGVKHADLAEITPFKGLELGAELGKLRFAFRKRRANRSKLLALVEQVEVVRGSLEDDFGCDFL
jgi:hypothetical protein